MESDWYNFSFSFQISMPHIESGQQAWYCSYSSIHTYPSRCGSLLISVTVIFSWGAPATSHSSGCILSLGSTRVSISWHPFVPLSLLLHLGKSPASGCLGIECFQPSRMYQVSYVFPSPACVPLVLSKVLAECVTGQFRLLFVVAPCWMGASWFPTVLNMLEDAPYGCPIINFGCAENCVAQTRFLFPSLMQWQG